VHGDFSNALCCVSAVLTSIRLLPAAQLKAKSPAVFSGGYLPCLRGKVIGLSRRKPGAVVGPYGIYGEQGCTRTDFFSESFVFVRSVSFDRYPMRVYSSISKAEQSQLLLALVKYLHPAIHLRTVHCTIFFLHPRLRSLYRSLTPRLPHLKVRDFYKLQMYSLQHLGFSQRWSFCYTLLGEDTVNTDSCLF
jgi:hypothetical protein